MADPTLGYKLVQQGINLTNSGQSSLESANASLSGAGALASPKAPTGGRQTPPSILRYPQAKLEKLDDYVEIKIIRYQRQPIKTGPLNLKVVDATTQIRTSRSKRILKTILLPMPKEVPQDTNQVTWGGESLNPLEAYGAEALLNILKSRNILVQSKEELQKLIATGKSAFVNGNAQDLVNKVIISQLLGSLGSNVSGSSLLSRATGQIINPNTELLFQNVNLRAFPFTFDLIPRDPSESQVVKDIIRTFKQSMTAKTTSASNGPGVGLFVSAPDVFEIRYKSGEIDHPFLNRFKPCALTNMTVNYAASGSYATYPDATPVHMVMQLTFSELNPIYNEDYETKEGKEGVGY